jgi:hypothetical protein
MGPLPAVGVVFLTISAWIRAAAGGKPKDLAVTERQLLRIVNDPRGPEAIIAGMPDAELTVLLDALFRHLDTSLPQPDAISWYQMGVAESVRRGL